VRTEDVRDRLSPRSSLNRRSSMVVSPETAKSSIRNRRSTSPELTHSPTPKKKRPAPLLVRSASEARAGSPYFFVLSTLLPITPPRIAPAAPPMIAPFTLFLLVTAPITAPAPAPMAASRLVCFTTTGAGAGAL
jgi:hypothetical protein